ncbi:MAG: hypothetical protein ABJB76_09275 [Candidatus Nitrosocosmicus sp.]
MNFTNFFKVHVPSGYVVMMISMFAILTTSSLIINYLNSDYGNIAFAQTTNTTNGNSTSNNSNNANNNNINMTNQQQQSQISSIANFTRSVGLISSVQNNASGKPSWILSGQWDLAIPQPLKINQTNPSNAVMFNAGFEMIKTDGKSMHTQTISDFKITGSAISDNALVLTGTGTVLMKDGPVKDVPISITILNQGALNLFIDPIKTNNHFGNTPIYGTVSSVGTFLTFP